MIARKHMTLCLVGIFEVKLATIRRNSFLEASSAPNQVLDSVLLVASVTQY